LIEIVFFYEPTEYDHSMRNSMKFFGSILVAVFLGFSAFADDRTYRFGAVPQQYVLHSPALSGLSAAMDTD
jgi:hypothetical protein